MGISLDAPAVRGEGPDRRAERRRSRLRRVVRPPGRRKRRHLGMLTMNKPYQLIHQLLDDRTYVMGETWWNWCSSFAS